MKIPQIIITWLLGPYRDYSSLAEGCYKSLYGPSNHNVICLLYRKSQHFYLGNNFFWQKQFWTNFLFQPNKNDWPLADHKSNSSNKTNLEQTFVFNPNFCYWPYITIWPAQLFSGPYRDLWPANGVIWLDNISLRNNNQYYVIRLWLNSIYI